MPRVFTPQIAWHGKDSAGKYKNDPILTVDVYSEGTVAPRRTGEEDEGTSSQRQFVIATGGADNHVRLWKIQHKPHDNKRNSKKEEKNAEAVKKTKEHLKIKTNVNVTHLVCLEGHAATVNCVRFSPSGEFLASASDDYRVLLWRRNVQKTNEDWTWSDIQAKNEVLYKMLSGHKSDVYALDWSPCGCFLVSGSTDNTVSVWNAVKGRRVDQFDDHSHYVQGVAWDPRDRYLLTQSCDRSCRVYGRSNEGALAPEDSLFGSKAFRWKIGLKCVQKIAKRKYVEDDTVEVERMENNVVGGEKSSSNENDDPAAREGKVRATQKTHHHMFIDETVQSFFRRLAFTPDGSACIVPTGQYKQSSSTDDVATSCTYLFARGRWQSPVVSYPTGTATTKQRGEKKRPQEPSVAASCCPILFELREKVSGVSPVLTLPYRMIFAVATFSRVLLYDTQQLAPIGVVESIHYAQITDLSWSPDGSMLMVSSQDGYCTAIAFEFGELGTPLPSERVPPFMKSKRRMLLSKTAHVVDTADSDSGSKSPPSEDNSRAKRKLDVVAVSGGGGGRSVGEASSLPGPTKKRATLIAMSATDAVASEAFR
eukprot:g4770.t1